MDSIIENLRCEKPNAILPVPPDLAHAFAPASCCLFEWTDYWVRYPGADRLRAGATWLTPVDQETHFFQIRFQNQLGLAALQPFSGQNPLRDPEHVEVISFKFPTPTQHLVLLRNLLDDLFSRAARLPFAINAATGRAVAETLEPPTPLFVLHFLYQHMPRMRAALGAIQASPHRELIDRPDTVPLAEAMEANGDVLTDIIHSPSSWRRATGITVARLLRGYAPERVWQRRPDETFNTPENRFVLSFLEQVLNAGEALLSQSWWENVPEDRRRTVHEALMTIRQACHWPLFSDVEPMRRFPLSSQVLLRRDGYRDLLALWQVFQHARRPLFAALYHAIDIRDIAKLYEIWAFLALVEDIGLLLEESPVIDLRLSDEKGIRYNAHASFGRAGTLWYNRSCQPPQSYSVTLRPDFSWWKDQDIQFVLDAKFRLERQLIEGIVDDESNETAAKQADLHKMHTYCDALGVRAAVCIYPGDSSLFYDRELKKACELTLRDLVFSDVSGVGALGMMPGDYD